MVTMVGTSSDFKTVLKDLLSLEFDAYEAYEATLNRLEDAQLKLKVGEYAQDHQRHIQELTALITGMGEEAPTGPDAKALLTQGKIVMAEMMGDRAILLAMATNETDTVTAYERAFNHKEILPQARDVIERAFADERRHKAWFVDTAAQFPKKVPDKTAA